MPGSELAPLSQLRGGRKAGAQARERHQGVFSNQDQLCCGRLCPWPGGQAVSSLWASHAAGPQARAAWQGGAPFPEKSARGGQDHIGGRRPAGLKAVLALAGAPLCGQHFLPQPSRLRPGSVGVRACSRRGMSRLQVAICRETWRSVWGPCVAQLAWGSGCRQGPGMSLWALSPIPTSAPWPRAGSGCCSWQECPLPRATCHPHLRGWAVGVAPAGSLPGPCRPQASCPPWSHSCQWAPQGSWGVPALGDLGGRASSGDGRPVLGALALGERSRCLCPRALQSSWGAAPGWLLPSGMR